MKTYKIAGYSYEKGYWVSLPELQAKTKMAALKLARKTYDADGFGYAEFVAAE